MGYIDNTRNKIDTILIPDMWRGEMKNYSLVLFVYLWFLSNVVTTVCVVYKYIVYTRTVDFLTNPHSSLVVFTHPRVPF